MKWYFDNELPIYTQIIQQIKQRIISGVYPLGSQLPPVRELADEISVNPNTVQKAMSLLEEEGIVYSKGTIGRFITDNPDVPTQLKETLALKHLEDFLQNTQALGLTKEEILKLVEHYYEEE